MPTDSEPVERDLELIVAMKALRLAARDLQGEVAQAGLFTDHCLDHLRATVSSLGQERVARAPVCPDARVQWSDFIAGNRPDIEPRAVRFLCWEPDVATDRRFHNYLDRGEAKLRARALQGLVRSCHARWCDELFAEKAVGNAVRRRIDGYDGTNRVVKKWKSAADLILGATGPEQVATDMVENRRAIKAECDAWTIEEQSLFLLDAVRRASERCRQQCAPESPAIRFLLTELLPWSAWPIPEFKKEVGASIVHRVTAQLPELTEGLKRFALQDARLRDPRLPSNARNWLGVPEEARQRVIQWLSRDDIEFFFEHVLPRGSDPHGRKDFWLRYVKRVLMSRPLLNWRDQARLQGRMAELRGRVGNFGRIIGMPDTSAFVLDFGRVVVVEFSRVGNACYVYEKSAATDLIPDFWTAEPFDVSGRKGLKQRSQAAARVRHAVGWQDELAMLLARHGVRPVSSRDDS